MRILLDTHTWAWTLTNNTRRLSASALELIAAAEDVFVSPLSVFEIGQKVRAGKWPEMAAFVDDLPSIALDQGASFAALRPEICLQAARMAWKHRDPFDRFLAATAIDYGLVCISIDAAFDELNGREGWLGRKW